MGGLIRYKEMIMPWNEREGRRVRAFTYMYTLSVLFLNRFDVNLSLQWCHGFH